MNGMTSSDKTVIFGKNERVALGWTWALASHELARGQVCGLQLLGRDLVVWRGADGEVRAANAHCPHMGAHLQEGRVEGNAIRCFFHNWKFDGTGALADTPCLNKTPQIHLRMWPVIESLGLIWIWPGDQPTRKPPYIPELENTDCQVHVLPMFTEQCHPNVVLINAIDEHHFNSVHSLPVDLYMKTNVVDQSTIQFSNINQPKDTHPLARVLQPFYSGPLTYSMSYHCGNTGSVTVGPDALHFHIVFALRLTGSGTTEGRRVLVTPRRGGLAGKGVGYVRLSLTNLVGNYFAHGDSKIFDTIKFDFSVPTKADHAIIDFVRHLETQPSIEFSSWRFHPPKKEAPFPSTEFERAS